MFGFLPRPGFFNQFIMIQSIALILTSFFIVPTFSPLVGQEPPAKEAEVLTAIRKRISKLNKDLDGPQFRLELLCQNQLALIVPMGHDLQFYLPTYTGPSAKKVPVETIFDKIFLWFDQDYLLPSQTELTPRLATSSVVQPRVFLLVVDRLEERTLFNVQYKEDGLLSYFSYASLRPWGHENCKGVPGMKSGPCGARWTCPWENHAPLCDLVNRGVAQLLKKRFGNLPHSLLGFAEIAEVAFTGNHYSYRAGGRNIEYQASIPERDGYLKEFESLSHSREESTKGIYIQNALAWKNDGFQLRQAVASWGITHTLLAHCKSNKDRKNPRTLGDLLTEIGKMEVATPEKVLAAITRYNPKFLKLFGEKLSGKNRDLHKLLLTK